MHFDPDVEKFFQILRSSGLPPLAQQTVEQARFLYREKTLRLGGEAAEMAEVRDLAASGPLGEIPLRLYRPIDMIDHSPALIYIHGGGWVIGDLESHDKVCRDIAAQTPCRVIAVDYRRAPEHPFPASQNDVIAAVTWIATNAAQLGIDKDRLAIGGDSAGGSMSAMACLATRENGPALKAQVLIYPSTDATSAPGMFPSRTENADVPPLTADAIKWFAANYMPKERIDTKNWLYSPLRAETLAGLPAALVLTAEYDMLKDEGKAYAERLMAAGVEVLYREYPGQIHGFIELAGILSAAKAAIAEIAAFLRCHL